MTRDMTQGRDLLGHEDAWREWRAAMASGRMHHAWILAGPEGLGKGSFARAAAAELVTEAGVPQPPADRHPDIVILEHLPATNDDQKKKDEGKPYQKRRNITIEQIRSVQSRLMTRPTLGNRRAVVIDPVDDLEKGAVNALLKSLEEPPAGTFFLLVAHQPGKLLATVRSRCRFLRFAPLDEAAIVSLVARHAPEADAATVAAAVAAAEGSPGGALHFIQHGLGRAHELMQRIVRQGDRDFALRGALTEELGARPDRERLLAAIELARATVAHDALRADRRRQQALIEAHSRLVSLSGQAPTWNFDPGLLILEIGGLLALAAMPTETASPA
ncbi:MAG: DNA polymerase III subunit delta' [Novosphingobium sp.]|nr:DNA polymerase III subunit delta' [Novosphingobium sp.]